MAIYFSLGVVMAFYFEDFSILPFMLMEMLGFGAGGGRSFRHAWTARA